MTNCTSPDVAPRFSRIAGSAKLTTLKSRIGRKAPVSRTGRASQRRGSPTPCSARPVCIGAKASLRNMAKAPSICAAAAGGMLRPIGRSGRKCRDERRAVGQKTIETVKADGGNGKREGQSDGGDQQERKYERRRCVRSAGCSGRLRVNLDHCNPPSLGRR